MNKIEVGKTYDTALGRRRCIYVEDDIAWMIFGADSCAWRWTVNGASIDLGSIHDVIWPAEPPKTITRTSTYPAPETKAPARGTEYFIPELSSEAVHAWNWRDDVVEYEAFHEGHTFADIVRWIMKNQVDAEELLTILCQAIGKEGNAQK